jgi:prepilin-type N-terminal cleavage/methylation domain-containing protein
MARKLRSDVGFTLVELLVVIVIIAILSVIAIPMFINQQKRAQDAATRSDVSNMALQILSIVEKQPDLPTVTMTGRDYYVDGVKSGTLSPNVEFIGIHGTTVADWCIDATNPKGNIAATQGFHWDYDGGPKDGTC